MLLCLSYFQAVFTRVGPETETIPMTIIETATHKGQYPEICTAHKKKFAMKHSRTRLHLELAHVSSNIQ